MQETFPQSAPESNSARKRRLAREFNEARAACPAGRGTSEIGRAEREELNALSKEVFGASSRWQKLVNNGYGKLLTEEVTELVPGKTDEEESTERKTQVPLRRADGAMQSVQEYHTVESVKAFMLERKAQIDAFRAQLKKMQEEQQAKKDKEALLQKVHDELHGSSI